MFVSLCLDAGLPLAGQLVAGIPLQPAMDGPYAATSVREFWGRRYNQIVSATLQETVYKPIVEGRWVTREVPAGAGASASAGAVASKAGQEGSAAEGGSNLAVRAGPTAAAEAKTDAGSGGEGVRGLRQRRRTPMWLAMTGLAASFLVSGIMHEIALW